MARPPRIFIEGIPIHVTMRGVEKRDVFKSDSDRLFYRAALDDSARFYGVAIHAYAFMSNHVHFLVTPRRADSIARLFQSLGPKYTGYFNRHWGRVGTLWQGRHDEFLVQTDRYFLTCMRYVEMNPVEAGMVRSPGDYPWSSYRHNALARPDSLVTPHVTFLAISDDPAHRSRQYRSLFDDKEDRRLRDAFRRAARTTFAVGDDPFLEWAALKTGRRLPRKPGV